MLPTTQTLTKKFKSTLHEVPDHLRAAMQLDCLVKTMPPDGACLFSCAADWIRGGVHHMESLRKEAHLFMIQNWDYYKELIPVPFRELVGTGENARLVVLDSYDLVKRFLLSDDSLYCYSNSSVDLQNLANMFDMRIAIFTYSINGTVTPHWTWIDPNPAISMKNSFKDRLSFKEMWLYHQDDVHYDLLVSRPLTEPSVYKYLPPVTDAQAQSIKPTTTEVIS